MKRPPSIESIEEMEKALTEFEQFNDEMLGDNTELIKYARALAETISDFQFIEGYFPMPKTLPVTLADMLLHKMLHYHFNQKQMAAFLNVPANQLSQILSGKRRVTLDIAKKLHERLNISPAFILRTA